MTCYLKFVHIVQRGAVGPLIEMLQSPEAQLKEMSTFALGRLAKKRNSSILTLYWSVSPRLHRVIKHYNKMHQRMPIIYVKLYSYQIFRALSYIHGTIRVCHRDIKPQNLLINPHTYQVKLCDFGSAKVLIKGDPNISYFCSRYYRAPELIDLARDTLVTMKIGTYKGDLAKVVDLDNVRQRVTVKLIPRIDLPALANKLEGREAPKKTTFTPPPRIFNAD